MSFEGEVRHLVGKSAHQKFESLSGSVCLSPPTPRKSSNDCNPKHSTLPKGPTCKHHECMKTELSFKTFSSIFNASVEKSIENQSSVGHPWLLGLGWKQKGWGAATSSFLGNGTGFSPRQHAPALAAATEGCCCAPEAKQPNCIPSCSDLYSANSVVYTNCMNANQREEVLESVRCAAVTGSWDWF